jgi:hypothetical protein
MYDANRESVIGVMPANCTAFLKPLLRSRSLSPTFRLLGKARFDLFFCERSFNKTDTTKFIGIHRSPEFVFAFRIRILL